MKKYSLHVKDTDPTEIPRIVTKKIKLLMPEWYILLEHFQFFFLRSKIALFVYINSVWTPRNNYVSVDPHPDSNIRVGSVYFESHIKVFLQ